MATTIEIHGTSNDTNLVLASDSASIADRGSVPAATTPSSVVPNVANANDIDVSSNQLYALRQSYGSQIYELTPAGVTLWSAEFPQQYLEAGSPIAGTIGQAFDFRLGPFADLGPDWGANLSPPWHPPPPYLLPIEMKLYRGISNIDLSNTDSSYNLGDTITMTVTGGTPETPADISASVDASGRLAFEILNSGKYLTLPTGVTITPNNLSGVIPATFNSFTFNYPLYETWSSNYSAYRANLRPKNGVEGTAAIDGPDIQETLTYDDFVFCSYNSFNGDDQFNMYQKDGNNIKLRSFQKDTCNRIGGCISKKAYKNFELEFVFQYPENGAALYRQNPFGFQSRPNSGLYLCVEDDPLNKEKSFDGQKIQVQLQIDPSAVVSDALGLILQPGQGPLFPGLTTTAGQQYTKHHIKAILKDNSFNLFIDGSAVTWGYPGPPPYDIITTATLVRSEGRIGFEYEGHDINISNIKIKKAT